MKELAKPPMTARNSPTTSSGSAARTPRWWHGVVRGLLCYGAWLVNAALAIVTAAYLREAIDRLGLALHWDPYGYTVVDEVTVIVLGLGWLVWVVVTESLYRTGLNRSVARFRRRVVQTTVPLLVLLALASLEGLLLGL
jgi:hypothetical protein